jgi:enamine deaminase RidA (YjgF/YER057c/UK114 family)
VTTSPPHPCSTTARRFAGARADELSILCAPAGTGGAEQQAEAAYRALMAALAAAGAAVTDLAAETLHLRDMRRDLASVLAARRRVLGVRGDTLPPALSCAEQTPVDGAALALAAVAVVPHARATWAVHDVSAPPRCGCAACAATSARVIRLGTQSILYSGGIHGAGADVLAQATAMFEAAEDVLASCDMSFRDVVRTWIYLRDIDRDYDALNRARRAFFERRGIDPRPASTGVQGGPCAAVHDVALAIQAVRASPPPAVAPMSTPALNEAWCYGADFSRGLRVRDTNRVTLHVSGTASIDEKGRTAHVGDPAAQVERMLHNIATLLAGQGASFADLQSGVVYLKRREDAPLLRAICRDHGFTGFPCAIVHAPLCRPELLCEAEAVAMLPLPRGGA